MENVSVEKQLNSVPLIKRKSVTSTKSEVAKRRKKTKHQCSFRTGLDYLHYSILVTHGIAPRVAPSISNKPEDLEGR